MPAPHAALSFLDSLGGPELILILVVVLIFFGGEKMPELARGLGKAIREFKKAAGDVEQEFKRAMDEAPDKALVPPAKPIAAAFPPYPPAPSAHQGDRTTPAAETPPDHGIDG